MREKGAKKYSYGDFEFYLWNDYIKKVKELSKPVRYVVRLGDRLDVISIKLYGTPHWWWIIALANDKKHCLDIKVGEVLWCPSYHEIKQIL